MKKHWFIAMLLMGGCSSMSVDPESVILTRSINPPDTIYVRSFSTATGEWVSTGEQYPEAFKQSQAASLTSHLIDALQQIAPTQAAAEPLPGQGLLVTGEFIKVDPGKGVSLTKVVVYDLERFNKGPVAWFEASASGGLETGWEKTAMTTVDFLEAKIGRKLRAASRKGHRKKT